MANEVARLDKPTAISSAEDEYSDWDFALACFVGTMDGTLLKELQAVAADPRVKRTPTDEAGNVRPRTLHNILGNADDKGAKKDGTRSTRARRVRSAPKPRVEIREQRRTRKNTLLIKVMDFNSDTSTSRSRSSKSLTC